MRLRFSLALMLLFSQPVWAQLSRPKASATTESARLAAEYFVQKTGALWTYEAGKSKAKVSVVSVTDWRSSVSFSFPKVSGNAMWRVRDGAWLEKALGRGEAEAIVLPAKMTRGTQWDTASSLESLHRGTSRFEVVAIDAVVELPNGVTLSNCLAVLEMAEGLPPLTHYYAPNVGKVGVMKPDGWLYRLSQFSAGSRGHAE
jgi:hypothetical protein